MTFDDAFVKLLGNEGGYSFNPSDPGGETMWGITRRVASENNYAGAMRDLSQDQAKAIYRKKYWDSIQADQLPGELRFEVFDAAVNSGPSQSVKWLQKVAGVVDDGVIGPMTIGAASKLNGYKAAAAFNGYRLDFMTSLPTWAAFGRGWARRIASSLQSLP